MTALLASSTATSPTATEGDVKSYLANLREFMSDLLGTDSTNKAAVQGLLGNILNGKVTKTGAYTVVSADRGKVIDCTGTWTMNIAAAATLGDGFCFAIRNSGTGAITIDPNLSETINGLTSFVIGGGEFVIVYCDGTRFSTVGGASAPVGTVMPTALATAPVGWLLCYGQAVSRTSYASLFNAIGTTYGAGDGSSTFNLPDLRGRVVAGKDNMGGTAASRLTSAGSGVNGSVIGASGGNQLSQGHNHAVVAGSNLTGTVGSRNALGDGVNGSVGGNVSTRPYANFVSVENVSTSTFGSGNSQNVQPTLVLNYMIKT